MSTLLGIAVLLGFGYLLYTIFKKKDTKYPTNLAPGLPDIEPDSRKDKKDKK